jgi:CDP-diacylglycerol--glycerol-3-phosphate 3-phosphatidyltransferase
VGPGGVRLQEWEREGWTYHAKGIWVSEAEEGETAEQAVEHPFLTFIGSSNLSTRSLQLDTELSLLLATSNKSLRSALGHELAHLREHAHDVGPETWATPERHVSLASRVLVALGVEGML